MLLQPPNYDRGATLSHRRHVSMWIREHHVWRGVQLSQWIKQVLSYNQVSWFSRVIITIFFIAFPFKLFTLKIKDLELALLFCHQSQVHWERRDTAGKEAELREPAIVSHPQYDLILILRHSILSSLAQEPSSASEGVWLYVSVHYEGKGGERILGFLRFCVCIGAVMRDLFINRKTLQLCSKQELLLFVFFLDNK